MGGIARCNRFKDWLAFCFSCFVSTVRGGVSFEGPSCFYGGEFSFAAAMVPRLHGLPMASSLVVFLQQVRRGGVSLGRFSLSVSFPFAYSLCRLA